jgi:pimeloyl-ACP methyl ester carboxylesterase
LGTSAFIQETERVTMTTTAESPADQSVTFERLQLPDTLIEYMVSGSGEPVLFTHGGLLSDVAVPLAKQEPLEGYMLIGYRRRGYAASDPALAPEGTTIADMATDAAALLDHLGIPRAHIVGHSMGGIVSLQFAADYPDRVGTLSLLEPPYGTSETAQASLHSVAMAPLKQYVAGDKEGAASQALEAVSDANWREHVSATVPDGVHLALSHADTFFQRDGAAIMAFEFGAEEAAKVNVPVLSIIGGETLDKIYYEGRAHFHQWWGDNVEDFDLLGANHLLPFQDPVGVACALGDFLSRHPL